MDLPTPIPTSLLNTLLAPALSSLATDLSTTTSELADFLSSPDLTDKLAALITNLEALEHLRALAARAPATAVCRSLLSTDDPVEQRRVAATLLRTPIHAPRRTPHPTPPQRTRRASQRLDYHTPTPPHTPAPSTDPAARDLESLLSLLLTPSSSAAAAISPAFAHAPIPSAGSAPAAFAPPHQSLPPDRTRASLGSHVPPVPLPGPAPAPTRPGITSAPPTNLPAAPTLDRRTQPSRAASLPAIAASPLRPKPRPP